MNTETNEQQSEVVLPGQRLRLAREKLGFSQQHVADKLCLKLSVVRDIEQDTTPKELASAFVRGYIRSYARLLSIPEQEVLPALQQSTPMAPKISPVKSINLYSRRSKKRREILFQILTVIIFLLLIGLTISWWWQNHKAAQQDLKNSVAQNSVNTVNSDAKALPLSLNNGDTSPAESRDKSSRPAEQRVTSEITDAAHPPAPLDQHHLVQSQSAAAPASSAVSPTGKQSDIHSNTPNQSVPPAIDSQQNTGTSQPVAVNNSSSLPVAPVGSESPQNNPSTTGKGLNFTFTDNCWLEVMDGSNKKLFSGLQKKGASLNLSGTLPYHVKIGAPSGVVLTFDNKPIDLSQFTHKNQVARLTLGAK